MSAIRQRRKTGWHVVALCVCAAAALTLPSVAGQDTGLSVTSNTFWSTSAATASTGSTSSSSTAASTGESSTGAAPNSSVAPVSSTALNNDTALALSSSGATNLTLAASSTGVWNATILSSTGAADLNATLANATSSTAPTGSTAAVGSSSSSTGISPAGVATPVSVPPPTTNSGQSKFSTALLVLATLLTAVAIAVLALVKRIRPQPGKRVGTNVNITTTDFLTYLTHQHPRILRHLVFFLLFVVFLFNLIAICLDVWSTSAVSDATVVALQGAASPSGTLTAGVLGISGLNAVVAGPSTYNCVLLFNSDDARTCKTIAVSGAFTLLFSLLSLLLTLVLFVWMCFVLRAHSLLLQRMERVRVIESTVARQLEAAAQSDGPTPPLQFHPAFFLLSALATIAFNASVWEWLAAFIALATDLWVPYSAWTIGPSWCLTLTCTVLQAWLTIFFSVSIELAPARATTSTTNASMHLPGGDANSFPIDMSSSLYGDDLNRTQGSEDGVDLNEEEAQEARFVAANNLTQ